MSRIDVQEMQINKSIVYHLNQPKFKIVLNFRFDLKLKWLRF